MSDSPVSDIQLDPYNKEQPFSRKSDGWCWVHEDWVATWHCDSCECGASACCATRYQDGTTICDMCSREEVQRSASKIFESLERWPEDEERLDSYWEDHEYG